MSLDRPNQESTDVPDVTDPRVMRALTHPLRLALIELLWRERWINATEAAAELDESQASCSFHLRQLAKFGFVEEVEGVRGRARPWRLSRRGLRFANVQDDPETSIAWRALERLLGDRQMDRYRAWLERRSTYSREWQEAAFHTHHVAWLTPEELNTVADQITELLVNQFPDRYEDPQARPAGALAVEFLSVGYPILTQED